MKFNKKDIKTVVMVVVASFVMALNIKSFVRTGGLYPGGAAGLTILIQTIFERFFSLAVPYTAINLLINAIPVYIGFRFLGKKFTLFSVLSIVLTGIFTDMLPSIIITYDTLLIAIFGGLINGTVVTTTLLAGATTGGTDFISMYLSQRYGKDSFDLILGINLVILSCAGLLFGWDKALYSIIFQYTSTQVLHTLYRKYQQETFLIVTHKAKEVSDAIYDVCRHGATILVGQGSHEETMRTIVYSVVSRADSRKVMRKVKEIDEKAFINTFRTDELGGRFYREPNE